MDRGLVSRPSTGGAAGIWRPGGGDEGGSGARVDGVGRIANPAFARGHENIAGRNCLVQDRGGRRRTDT